MWSALANVHGHRCELASRNTQCDAADFSRAELDGALCSMSRFLTASFAKANLSGATLQQCSLDAADFSKAISSGTVWAGIDLRDIRNLEDIDHRDRSTVGLDTVTASRGAIPEVFLRGCGLPDAVIAYVGSIATSDDPIQLYSCFISHSSRDLEFCQRLHNDLQAAGVWFAPEHLKIGDKFRDEIESAIHVHDKHLLVLSEHSVRSAWVAAEVERAFEREQRERERLVLCPVRLDDAVMKTSQAWAADIRRQRHIGDFTGWRDHDAYQQALQRLLRDLRADSLAG